MTSPCPANRTVGTASDVVRLPGELSITGEIAPWLIGVPCSSVLLGVVLLEAFRYFNRWGARDGWHYRGTVALLALGCVALWGVTISDLFWVSLGSRNDDCTLALAPLRAFVPIASVPWFAVISQTYFASKCFRIFGRSRPIAYIFLVLILAGLSCALAALAMIPEGGKPVPLDDRAARLFPYEPGSNTRKQAHLRHHFMMSAFAINAGTDLLLTGLLVLKFRSMQRHWNQQTDTVLTQLCALAVLTGLPPAVAATASAILIGLILPLANWPLVVVALLPPLYSACCIGSLNLRSVVTLGGDPTAGRSRSRESSAKRVTIVGQGSQQRIQVVRELQTQVDDTYPPPPPPAMPMTRQTYHTQAETPLSIKTELRSSKDGDGFKDTISCGSREEDMRYGV